MKYGKYVLMVTDKEGKEVAMFTANDKDDLYEMVFKSNFCQVDKYYYEIIKPERR